jgi:hypothetical protein
MANPSNKAFSERAYQTIRQSISGLRHRAYAHASDAPFRVDQILDLITPPEHRAALRTAAEVANIEDFYGHEHLHLGTLFGPEVRVTLKHTTRTKILVPQDPQLQSDADPELMTAFTQWVTAGIQLEKDWGRVRHVFDVLAKRCASPSQVRYVWPSIVALCKMRIETEELARQLADFRQPRNLPKMDLPFMEACRKAAATVTTALFLDDTPSPKKALYIQVDHATWDEGCGKFSKI